MTTPGNGESRDIALRAERVHKLAVDGYIRHEKGQWLLTLKGWAVLFAEAEGPIYRPKGKSP